MKDNMFPVNPYTVLGVSRSASIAEITRAMAEAMKRKQFPVDVIAKAQKSLINPQKRILADYLSPILPVIERLKRQDYSELNTPTPTLEFLTQFDALDLAIAQSSSITPADETLGKILFFSVSTTGLAVSHSNELEDDYLNAGQFDELEQPFSNLYLPVLAPLESVSSRFSTTSLSTRPKVQVFATSQSKSNRLLRVLVVILLAIVTFLVSVIVSLSDKLDIFNPTSSVSTPPQLVTASTSPATQTATPESVRSTPVYEPSVATPSNAISPAPDPNLTPQNASTPFPRPKRAIQQASRYSFPTDTCGDRDPGGTNTWYPVYANYSQRNLSLIQSRYCRDAIRKYREAIGLNSIQVASFLNRSDAQEFAALLKSEIGSGEVGDPDTRDFAVPAPVAPDTSRQQLRYGFPANTCGDRNPGGMNTWYPVYVNYSERNLSLAKDRYCRDAIKNYRENLGLHSIQIASFLSQADAQEFAALMRREIGSGEVGEPKRF